MTFHEAEFAFWAIVGLAGCAIALVALVADWRAVKRRRYTLDFGDQSSSWSAGPPAVTVTSRKVD